MLKNIAVGLIVIFTLGALIGFFADISEVWETLRGFDWWLAPALLALTVVSFGFRYLRWQLFLDMIGGDGVNRKDALLSFLAGLSGLLTPMKAGELSRVYFAKGKMGVSPAKSIPIILSERLLDGVAMIALGGIALLIYVEILAGQDVVGSIGVYLVAAVIVLLVIGGVIFVLRQEGIDEKIAGLGKRLFKVDDGDIPDEEFGEATRRLFRADTLAISTAIGMGYWGAQAVVYFAAIVSFGEPIALETLVLAFFIYPMAMLIGTLTLLPFGLGTMDASLVFLGSLLLELSESELVAAALVSRIFILIPALITGLVAVASPPIRSQIKQQ